MAKLTYGVGFNSKRKHLTEVDGKPSAAYVAWHRMIGRCYNPKQQEARPTYIGCLVHKTWHDFQDFADWYYAHPHGNLGYQLDKDILKPGNKVYSPETCCFVPQELNVLLTDSRGAKGEYPQGVKLEKRSGNFTSQLSVGGKIRHIGTSRSPEDAYQKYRIAKERYVKDKALEWQDRIAENVFEALMRWTLDG